MKKLISKNNKVKTQCTKKLVKKALTGTSLNNPPHTYSVQGLDLLLKEKLYQDANPEEQDKLRKQMKQNGQVSWDYDTQRNASVPKEYRDMEDRYAQSSTVESISDNHTLWDNDNYQQLINQKSRIYTNGGDTTWMYNNERINGNNSDYNAMHISTNPTGGYDFERITNGEQSDFQQGIDRNSLPEDALQFMAGSFTESPKTKLVSKQKH